MRDVWNAKYQHRILMRYSIGISDSYYIITESELLEDYIKAIDFLSIDRENQPQTQLTILGEQNYENNYLIKGKLQEKDEEIDLLKCQMNERDDAYSKLADKVSQLIKEINEIKGSLC